MWSRNSGHDTCQSSTHMCAGEYPSTALIMVLLQLIDVWCKLVTIITLASCDRNVTKSSIYQKLENGTVSVKDWWQRLTYGHLNTWLGLAQNGVCRRHPQKPNSHKKKNHLQALGKAESRTPHEHQLECTSRREIINLTAAARHTGETLESSHRGRRWWNSSPNFTNNNNKAGIRGHRK